jgi:hypothetical protein
MPTIIYFLSLYLFSGGQLKIHNKFKASQSYIAKPFLKQKKKEGREGGRKGREGRKERKKERAKRRKRHILEK